MPSITLLTLSADEIDDLLYFARTNSLEDLIAGIDAIAQTQRTSFANISAAAVDPESGNNLLHMASANGCMDVLTSLFPLPHTTSSNAVAFNANFANKSGNTPLHWAALNGHLEAVKHLVGAGADPAIRNNAGHDAVYEAETGEKEEVVRWLLTEGTGLEMGVGNDGSGGEVEENEGEEEAVGDDRERDEAGKGKDGDADGVRDVEIGLKDIELGNNG